MNKKCNNCGHLRPYVDDHCPTCGRRVFKFVGEWLNPRFVWNIGAIAEVYPELNEFGQGCLIDRQEKKVVVKLFPEYGNAFCLELTTSAPFTKLEEWFNGLDDTALSSEGMTATKPEFRA